MPHGVIANSTNGYANGNGIGYTNGWNSYGSAPPPVYMNGTTNGYHQNGYQANGGGTYQNGTAAHGHIQIPEDPIEAQELALALAASNAQQQRQNSSSTAYQTGTLPIVQPGNEDAELKAAMEASLAEEQRRRNQSVASTVLSSDDAELNAAIQASLEEQRRQQQQYTASGWQEMPATAPPPPSYSANPFAEWPPRS